MHEMPLADRYIRELPAGFHLRLVDGSLVNKGPSGSSGFALGNAFLGGRSSWWAMSFSTYRTNCCRFGSNCAGLEALNVCSPAVRASRPFCQFAAHSHRKNCSMIPWWRHALTLQAFVFRPSFQERAASSVVNLPYQFPTGHGSDLCLEAPMLNSSRTSPSTPQLRKITSNLQKPVFQSSVFRTPRRGVRKIVHRQQRGVGPWLGDHFHLRDEGGRRSGGNDERLPGLVGVGTASTGSDTPFSTSPVGSIFNHHHHPLPNQGGPLTIPLCLENV